jgi:hypothetical protein
VIAIPFKDLQHSEIQTNDEFVLHIQLTVAVIVCQGSFGAFVNH